ncbi:SRPBCC family protein [Planomonospora sp. ID67723]|uniref:SRPBCC family protein n=1 Tax=Planomonospora sp. ID67723 TaxID=2738134 RepID=UPI0018C3E25B|nr:SRPBCC family protein [Planomonospora sp. ID67723]MBG0831452.1 SRPBCC family protein [Planomonospora sp. ID67723]
MASLTAGAAMAMPVPADPRMLEIIGDYTGSRRRILTEHFSAYEVLKGGQGEGTLVRWKIAVGRWRVYDCLMSVTRPDDATVIERDTNSSMMVTWAVPQDGGQAHVAVQIVWDSADGVAGIAERIFAPARIHRIYAQQLQNLEVLLRGSPSGL